MSNQIKLFEKFENLLLKKEILTESIENAIPKIPHLLRDSDIDFLEQFDKKYWAKALAKRYDELFDYLTNLALLRKIVYDQEIPNARKQEQAYWSNPKFSNISDLAKQQKINLQSDGIAKAKATKLFPAGYKIDYKKLFTGEYGKYFNKLSPEIKDQIENVVDNINNVYLSNKEGIYGGFRVGAQKKEDAYHARSYLAQFARELEGTFGNNDGYDLNNPKKISGSIGDKDASKYATDGFLFPTHKTIEKQLLRHIKAIGTEHAKPADDSDVSRLAAQEGLEPMGRSEDEGVGEIEKQLRSYYEKVIIRERQVAGLPKLKPNQLRQEAIKRSLKYLENYTGDNIKKHLSANLAASLKAGDITKIEYDKLSKQLNNIQIPYANTEIVQRSGGDQRLAISRKRDVMVPVKTITIQKADGDKRVATEVKVPVLIKSNLKKPVKLLYKNDSPNIAFDSTGTDLISPTNAIGEKYFDPLLFERLFRRAYAKFPSTPEGMKAKKSVEKILKKHNLRFGSSIQEIIEASKRFMSQQASLSDYTQGSNVSATYGVHPTRMSAQSNFLNKHHNPAKHDQIIDILMDKGVYRKIEKDGSISATPFVEYVEKYVDDFLFTGYRNDLNKLFLQRVQDILVQLGQLKILENLDTPRLIMDAVFHDKDKPPVPPDYYANPKVINRLLKNEMLRYSRQDFFLGSRRTKGQTINTDLIDALEKDSNDLSCKISQRSWRTGVCLHGAELRTINVAAERGTDIIRSVESEKSHVLMDAKKKIRLAIEGYWDLFKVLYSLYKAQAKRGLKLPKSGDADKQIKAAAVQMLTNWVTSHASLQINEFVAAFVNEYNNLLSGLKGVEHEIPANLRTKEGKLKNPKQISRSIEDQVSTNTGRKVFSDEANLSTEQIANIINNYQKQVNDYPYKMSELRNQFIENLPANARIVFEKRNKPFDNMMSNKIAKINNPSNVMSDFYHNIINPSASPDADAAYFTENTKYLSFNYIKSLFDNFLVETFTPKELADYRSSVGDVPSSDPAFKRQKISLGKILYAELVRRNQIDEYKTKTQLLESLRQFMALPGLQSFVKSYESQIQTGLATDAS